MDKLFGFLGIAFVVFMPVSLLLTPPAARAERHEQMVVTQEIILPETTIVGQGVALPIYASR